MTPCHSRKTNKGHASTATVVQRSPRHAWWRDLLLWQGSDTRFAHEAPSSRSPVVRSSSSAASCSGDRVPPLQSEHLKWAKQVSLQQRQWFDSAQRMRRPRQSNALPPQPLPHTTDWTSALRFQGDPGPSDWQKKKCQKIRTQLGLRRLQSVQLQWRQKQLKRSIDSASAEMLLPVRHDGEARAHDSMHHAPIAAMTSPILVSSQADEKVGAAHPESDTCDPEPATQTALHPNLPPSAAVLPAGTTRLEENGSQSPSSGLSSGERSRSASSCHTSNSEQLTPVTEATHKKINMRYTIAAEVVSASNGKCQQDKNVEPSVPCVYSVLLPPDDPAPQPLLRRNSERSSYPSSLNLGTPRSKRSCENDDLSPATRRSSSRVDMLISDAYSEHWSISSTLSSKRSSITKAISDDFDRSHVSIFEEFDEYTAKKKISDCGSIRSFCAQEAEFGRMDDWGIVRLWEEWRVEFPMEVLDILASFYESTEADNLGWRRIALDKVQRVAGHALGFPANAICDEAKKRGLLDTSWQSNILFTSLGNFLDFIRAVVAHVEQENPAVLWTQEDFLIIKRVFMHRANASDRLPVCQLFEAVQALGFSEFGEMCDAQQQQWLANITRNVLAERDAVPKQEVGLLSIQAFAHIVSAALREKERKQRREDFMHEEKICSAAGFSPIEVEDLRELYGDFLKMEVEGNPSLLAKVMLLLTNCGVRPLTSSEVSQVQNIIKSGAVNCEADVDRNWTRRGNRIYPQGRLSLRVPFFRFVYWMQHFFLCNIGDLKFLRQSQVTLDDLEQRVGFVAAMLREHLWSKMGSAGYPSRRTSALASSSKQISSRRTSLGLLSIKAKCGEGHMHTLIANLGQRSTVGSCSASRSASWNPSRNPSRNLSRNPSWNPSQNPSRNPSQNPSRNPSRCPSASRIVSRARSKNLSRNPSRTPSLNLSRTPPRSASKSNPNIVDSSGKHQVCRSGVLHMHGLPPSEAMLSRKLYRACSLECAPDRSFTQNNGIDTKTLGGESKVNKQGQESELPTLLGSSSLKRKKKSGLASDKLVRDAVAKLEILHAAPLYEGTGKED